MNKSIIFIFLLLVPFSHINASTLVKIFKNGYNKPCAIYPTSELDSIEMGENTIGIFFKGDKKASFTYNISDIDSISFKKGVLTKPIAHRGFWDIKTSAQNSRRSLIKADSIGCYGSEFDIWITKDGKLVVHHDAKIGDKKIEDVSYNEIKDSTLNNGETLPTLDEYLKTAKKLKINLICEIKPHSSTDRENACTDSTVAHIKRFGLINRTTFISFSLNVCKRIKSEVPNNIYYLNGDMEPYSIAMLKFTGIDYDYAKMINNHNWIIDCHKLGLKAGVWTINDEESLSYWIDKNADFITTNDPVTLLNLIKIENTRQ